MEKYSQASIKDIVNCIEAKIIKQDIDIYGDDGFISRISISCIDDIFIYLKSIRGKAAYYTFKALKKTC